MTDEEIVRLYFHIPKRFRKDSHWTWIGTKSAWERLLALVKS